MNQSQHDELSRLFAQNMQLSQQMQQQGPQVQQTEPLLEERVVQDSEKQQQQALHFTSSHYTGTAHIRPDTTSEPSRSPPPPYHEAIMPEAMAEALRQHSVEPSALLPNQIHLFLNADYEQRLRLLELWRIAPPSYPLEEHLNGTWISTSLEREETLARARYEQQMLGRSAVHEEHMLDTHVVPNTSRTPEPISPIREAGEPAWPPLARIRAASIAANSRPGTRQGEAEPYIVNGYSADRSSRAMDPVYSAAAGLWQAPSYAQAVEQATSMADQYGMYEQIRNHADWERMNEQIAREKLQQVNIQMEDDDMEL